MSVQILAENQLVTFRVASLSLALNDDCVGVVFKVRTNKCSSYRILFIHENHTRQAEQRGGMLIGWMAKVIQSG